MAPSRGPRPLRLTLAAIGGGYLLALFLTAAVPKGPTRALPRVPRYFTQVACLFPHAARRTIDYRLEVWRCVNEEFVELDPRHHFPIHPNDKENRFHRTGHFYRRNRSVMRALERYVVAQESARVPGVRIGGIRVSSLRIPIPEVGEPLPRWSRKPLDEYPADQRKAWYYTPVSRRKRFCAGEDPDTGIPLAATSGASEQRGSI